MKGQVCFVYLEKVSDTLGHRILLNKLSAYGFRGPILEILTAYLNDSYRFSF